MGGNALKQCKTRRYDADEYYELVYEVGEILNDLFPNTNMDFIKAYANKKSFGDMDVLLQSEGLPNNWQNLIIRNFQPKGYVKNGNCFSFEYKEFQIDLITVPVREFWTSYDYFAYNDLGNLLGRVAHSMGLKLGHDGLSYNWRVDTYQFRNIVLLTDWEDILPVLGYSYERYQDGFDEIEDIFEFVASSPFFDPDIYLLHNRNHTSRVRDVKRKTYMEFLKWVEDKSSEDKPRHNNVSRKADKNEWLPYLFEKIPGFKDTYEQVQAEWELEIKIKQAYNGDIVRDVLQIDGKELGHFMKYVKETRNNFIRTMFHKLNPEVRPGWIKYWYDKYLKESGMNEFENLKVSGQIELTQNDAELLIDLMDNPPEPNEKLKRAAGRYYKEKQNVSS